MFHVMILEKLVKYNNMIIMFHVDAAECCEDLNWETA